MIEKSYVTFETVMNKACLLRKMLFEPDDDVSADMYNFCHYVDIMMEEFDGKYFKFSVDSDRLDANLIFTMEIVILDSNDDEFNTFINSMEFAKEISFEYVTGSNIKMTVNFGSILGIGAEV